MAVINHYAISEIESANTDHIINKVFDVPYAFVSQSQKLDIYLPDEMKGPYPVIISIHGGAFMGGDKADIQVLPMLEGLKRGYAVISINYRLSGEAIFPALIHDVKAAIRWIRAYAKQYDLNADKISVWGGSAGGYLATFAGISAEVTELEDLELGNAEQSCKVQAVVSWFAPTNFLRMDSQLAESGLAPSADRSHCAADSPESLILGVKITEANELVEKANPETYINVNIPPFLIQHGTMDSTVPVQQSIEFANKLKNAAGSEKVILDLLYGAEHADKAFETEYNVNKVLNFLDKYLKNS